MSNQPPSSRWPAILLLLAAIIVPAAAFVPLKQTISGNPLLASVLFIIYELVIIIFGIVRKIWQRLESKWLDSIADWIDVRVQMLLSGYQKHYYEYIRYRYRDFDVKGLTTQGTFTLELEQVFVELSIDPTPPHQTSPNPVRIPEVLGPGGHSIWNFLASEQLANQQLAIIGPPGSGKTTLLKHMALTLVDKKQSRRPIKIPHKVPVLLFLRDQVNALKENPNLSLVDAVETNLRKWDYSAPSGWLEERLTNGKCLILLDGIDEVADLEVRKQVVNWIEQQMVAYRKNRFIITSRPHGYRSNPLNGVVVLEVQPFTYAQVEQFIYKWYVANEIKSSRRDDPGVRLKAREDAGDLIRRLHDTPDLFSLATNPLLLTMIATVHRYRSSLPGKRVALYEEICEVFLGKQHEARGLQLELSPKQKQSVLQPLAYHMMCKGLTEIDLSEALSVIKEPLSRVNSQIAPNAFLQIVENTSGLLLEKEHEIYVFAHKTFQEYLAARYMRENKLEYQLLGQVEEGWWHETIRLYCAQADATAIIQACLKGNPPSVTALRLAQDCQEEAFQVDSRVIVQLNNLLNQGIEDSDPEKRYIVIQALLEQRVNQMILLGNEKYAAKTLITCAEYQLFIDEQLEQGNHFQPDHWTDNRFPTGLGRTPVLGVRASDAIAFCNWLTDHFHGAWQYRLPNIDEVNKENGIDSIANRLVSGTGYWTNEGQEFVWARESSQLSDNMNPELLNHYFASDQVTALNLQLDFDRPRDRIIDLNRKYAFNLNRTIILDRDLSQGLASTLKLSRACIQDLKSKLEESRSRVNSLEVESNQTSYLKRQLNDARRNIQLLERSIARVPALENEFDEARDQARSLERQLDKARAQKGSRGSNSTEVTELERKYNNASSRVQNLQKEVDASSISSLKLQLDDARSRAYSIESELDNVQKRVPILQKELDEIRNQARSLEGELFNARFLESNIKYACDIALKRTPLYFYNQALDHALTSHRFINLDSIIANINQSNFEKVLVDTIDLAYAYARNIVQILEASESDQNKDHYHFLGLHNTKTDELFSSLSQVQALARELADTLFNSDVRSLIQSLKLYFDRLSRKRARERNSTRFLLWYIRYITQVLANNLSYWSSEELFSRASESTPRFSNKEQWKEDVKCTIDVYLGACVTFAILEERINGGISACEGILIVKEH